MTPASIQLIDHHVDPFGLPLTLQRPESLPAVHGFIEGFLGYEPRILDILQVAISEGESRDDSPIVRAYAAALHMFSESREGPPGARAHLERAGVASAHLERAEAASAHQAPPLPATARELSVLQAVTAWVDGDVRQALGLLESVLREHPRDLTSLKLAQYLAFNLGDSPTMLRLALLSRDAAPEWAWTHGMLAFAFEQCHRLDEAQASAHQALRLNPQEPWAQHALAHILLTRGQLREGAQFLERCSPGWHRLTSFMRTHNWWHLAVFLLDLGDDAQALKLYDEQVWGVEKSYTQDQIGAVSLLARLELAGVDVGSRWQELAPWIEAHVHDQVQPFLDLQYLYGLARAQHPQARVLLSRIEQFAPEAPLAARQSWQRVAVPAARGLFAHAQERWAEAVQGLEQALPQLVSIGGSHAQRDLFEQIHLDALIRSGQWAGAHNRLQPLAHTQPQSVRIRRQLGALNAALGLPDEAFQAPKASAR